MGGLFIGRSTDLVAPFCFVLPPVHGQKADSGHRTCVHAIESDVTWKRIDVLTCGPEYAYVIDSGLIAER